MQQSSAGIADDFITCEILLFSVAFVKSKAVFLFDQINGIL